MSNSEIETFYPKNKKEWRQWLETNHHQKQSIWVICYKKNTGKQTINWSEAVDEALCYGWIDSTRKSVDIESFIQRFSKRKPKSAWSDINKKKIEILINEELMTEAGLKVIQQAKEDGSWAILDEVEKLIIPNDLENAFGIFQGAKIYFLSLSKSTQKAILQWIIFAKRDETRKKRIHEIASLASQGLKPKQF